LKRPWALPLAPLYAAGAALRSAGLRLGIEPVRRLAWPVISVGSLSAGGAGKTPFVIALAELLRSMRRHVDVLSRGYGRTGFDAREVILNGSADAYGDEPLLMREAGLPVYVGARRWDAGWLAEAVAEQAGLNAGVHLLDDGFQHRQLARDVDIVLVSSEDLKDWLLPAGNLREGAGALGRATVLAVEAGDDAAARRLRTLGLRQPVWRFRRKMDVPAVHGPVVAFCGIARPGQFLAGLERAGLSVAGRHAFADHHRFGAGDVALLRRLVSQTGASALITTAKDRVRLGSLEIEPGLPVHVAGLRVEIEDAEAAREDLRLALDHSGL
jgi:tetraacyldisaccharide 4'-kinase